MKSVGWKDVVEFVGIVAIVASLVFVGQELRQTRDIALSERGVNILLAEIEARRPIYEFPDIWARGNAGEELNRSETVIYETLIRDINSYAFHKYQSALRMGNQDSAKAAIRDLAGFLYGNPGARGAWESLRDMLHRQRAPNNPGKTRSAFEVAVRADLEVLKNAYGP